MEFLKEKCLVSSFKEYYVSADILVYYRIVFCCICINRFVRNLLLR